MVLLNSANDSIILNMYLPLVENNLCVNILRKKNRNGEDFAFILADDILCSENLT